jgi:O-antigen/teichoic acid export membrane protein
MLCSNYSIPLTIYFLPLRIALDIIAFFYAMSKLDWKHMAAIGMAIFWLISHPHLILKKRRKNKYIKSVKDRDIIKNMFRGSIVLAYYILCKKTYREIVTNAES